MTRAQQLFQEMDNLDKIELKLRVKRSSVVSIIQFIRREIYPSISREDALDLICIVDRDI